MLDRYLFHSDFQNKKFRLFTQFRFNNVYGRGQGPRSLDRDEGDIYGLHHSHGRDYLDDRFSLGLRNKYQSDRLRIDFESIVQVAHYQESLFGAFSLGLDMDYRLPGMWDKMNIGFISLYTSGANAGGANAGRSMTFHPLYPTNKNLRNIDLLGKHNLVYFEPYIQYGFSKKDKLILEVLCYWKASPDDHVYTIPGTQLNLSYKYYLNPFLQAEAGYRVLIASRELRKQTGAGNINYLLLGLIFRF